MSEADLPKRPLWDTQWSNIVNANNCWRDYSKEDAVHEAVKMTEDAIAKNQAKASEWQPIDTAPKDGSPIILGRPEIDDSCSFSGQGRWHEEDHDGPDNMGHDAGFLDDDCQVFGFARSCGNPKYQSSGRQPTHWMPLPAPPKSTCEQKEKPE